VKKFLFGAFGLWLFVGCQTQSVRGGEPADTGAVSSRVEAQRCSIGGEAPLPCPSNEICNLESNTCEACSEGLVACNNECIDSASFTADSLNCGACRQGCAQSSVCEASVCTCGEGRSRCALGSSSICTSLQTDKRNCGQCGQACGTEEQCVDGRCVAESCAEFRYCDCGVWVRQGEACPATVCNPCPETLKYCGCGQCVASDLTCPTAPIECVRPTCPQKLEACGGGVFVGDGVSCPGLPSVTLLEPYALRQYSAPASLNVVVGAKAAEGRRISSVEVRDGETVLCTLVALPYQCVVEASFAKTYALKAVAVDDLGARAESSVRTIEVQGAAVGETAVGDNRDSNPEGLAEAFVYTAKRSAVLRQFRVYIDEGTTARVVQIGLYSDVDGAPGQLLARGSVNSPSAGAWAQIYFEAPFAVPVVGGQRYWLAVLTPVGKGVVRFRDRIETSLQSVGTRQTRLTALPFRWVVGERWVTGNGSIYATH
jgi:hypothetical protein